MKKFYYLLLLLVGFGMSRQATAQIVGWQFTSPAVAGNEATLPPTLAATGLSSSDLSRGAGWAASSSTLARTFVSQRVGTATDTTAMVAQNMYFTFTLTVNADFKASLSYLTYRIRLSSSAGAKLWFWKYSLNGSSFNRINDPVVLDPTATYGGEGTDQPTVNISGISRLQNLPAGSVVTFRLYAGNSGTGSTAIGRSATSTTTDYAMSVGGSVENMTNPPLLAWQFTNPLSNGDEVSVNASLNNANLNTSTLVRGGGMNTVTTYPRSFSAGANVASTTALADTAIAVANNLYMGFNVNVKAGSVVTLSKLRYKIRRSGGGAYTYYWKYSTDGIVFNKLAEPYQLVEQNNLGVDATPIDLSIFPKLKYVQPTTTIYLRLYLSGSNNSTGSTNIGQSDLNSTNSYVLAVEGNIDPISVLPIQLVSFTGKNTGNSNTLYWQTASEKNNAYFEILGLRAGKAVVLGTVAGSGTTTATKNYNFKDLNPLAGTNYYQLRQVDENGDAATSGVVAVKNALQENTFSANLASGNLTINTATDKAGHGRLVLTDLSGKTILNQAVALQEGQTSLSFPVNLQKGVYIVTLYNGTEKSTKKLIN